MELDKMIYLRLSESDDLSKVLAKYSGRSAVFSSNPPTADDKGWEGPQYPRINYTVDMQENPSRNTSGVLALHVWCDARYSPEPEDVESIVRNLLHSVFAQADDDVYCLSWVRSDAFEVKSKEDESVYTIGMSLTFDIMACPCQYTTYPDPIEALSRWTKAVIPDAVVIGLDTFSGWLVPTKEKPVIYWRLTSQGIQSKHFTHSWLSVSAEGHVYARNSGDRLINLVRLNTAHSLADHLPMEDKSPLFLRNFACKPNLNPLTQGQIQVSGHFGVLKEWYGKRPDPPLKKTVTEFSAKE